MRSFVKIKPSRNSEIFLSFAEIGKSCPNHKILTSQICLLRLLVGIKFSRKTPNLQYFDKQVLFNAFIKLSQFNS